MGLRDRARESASKPATEPPPEKEAREPPQETQEAPPQAPEQEAQPPAEEARVLEQSVTYLVEEEKPDLAYSLFIAASAQGMRGMIISRTYPKNLRKGLNLGDVPIYWLTNAMSDDAVGPKDLERLTLTIKSFLEEREGQLVLIDSLEYVITNNCG
jgi:FtsZ-interacting cell division protein ZipA